MSTRFKLLSGLKIGKNITQDGRFGINVEEGLEIDMRVSIVPGEYGDNYVMRILDPRAANVPLESLGINEILYKKLIEALEKPFGMILNTGPTGSGKSTTLYSCLRKAYNPEIKIITIEDPIEYRFEGITQTQVNIKNNYTFLAGLRAAMRQDPDIILVGEIRDPETANTAVNAALTGHVVLSTLHTNSAAGCIPRLLGFGIEIGLIASSLNLVLAQRLCRKLCQECKVQISADDAVSNVITQELGKIAMYHPDIKYKPSKEYIIYRANINGCPKCNKGYKGRVAIAEGITMTKEIEAVLNPHTTESQIREVANSQGIPTLKQDAIFKLLDGVTSFEEASEVVDMRG
ncbi:MAG: GspE/PulE family protein [Cyanobium sp. MAG06]|nr:GspE/PulE family protein [Cyanobium sp. MAG06]